MRGTSRVSLQGVADRFEPVLLAAGAEAATIGEQMFTLVDALDGSGSLRRTLTDPSVEGEAKAGLARRLLADARPEVADVVADLVSQRWSDEEDLTEGIEELGFWAVLASADAAGDLLRVEQELFALTRALVDQREVRRALADPAAAPERRAALVEAILGGGAADGTSRIARRAAVSARGRRFVATLTHVGDLAAARRRRIVASVTSRTELTAAQRERLAGILASTYGSDIQINVSVDPTVLGGLRVQVGADVVDATVLTRLDDARRRLAG
ncbi:F0F1 ATP synthase subunit delta [Cellulomonas sp. ATA003]|uniref:F0F1 ATP synthase subunit delta n=1 Tax=Cellulomonas sp. ATA003 TaxID=3073064 RepID=UPI0028737E17|nr:F0F1 ATP synthase subunit delta [Cellulomonas sp. ATA003]WNB84954.1 F0F1 ATP synthase subunit delta [Cellulomonas sp. ATA003]